MLDCCEHICSLRSSRPLWLCSLEQAEYNTTSGAKGHHPSQVIHGTCTVVGAAAHLKMQSRSPSFLTASLFPLLSNTRLTRISICPAAQQQNTMCFQFSWSFPCSSPQMLCLSLFLPVYSSSKRHWSTEMHPELRYMWEKLFWQVYPNSKVQRCSVARIYWSRYTWVREHTFTQ